MSTYADGTPFRNSYYMEYQSIYFKYYRTTSFQLSIEYVDINYFFANFKYAKKYVSISY